MAAQDIALLILGWLLGLLSPAIVDAIKNRREAAQGRIAILNELTELSLVITFASYKSALASGLANRAFLEWVISVVDEISDGEVYRDFKETVQTMLTHSDQQLAGAHQAINADRKTSPILQNYAAPLLDSRISALWTFNTDFQRKLFVIKRNLSLLDATVVQIKEYFRMTFDDLTPGNRQIIDGNITTLYKNYTERAKIVVDQIRELLGVGV